jgi:dihydroorotate dehydrogenase electron transfer subunit
LVYRTIIDKLRAVKITKIVEESSTVNTLSFNDKISSEANPGQFLMVWIPGIDEIPMSISTINNYTVSITVRNIGVATNALYNKKPGELIGVRGPYGTNFEPVKGNILLVGAGTGLAPLLFFAESLLKDSIPINVVIGVKNKNELVFSERAKKIALKTNGDFIITTEDGSYGKKGLPTTAVKSILSKKTITTIYTCGPELMIKTVFDLADQKSISVQASLERFMKCGIGICGSCCMGKYLVCKDGPIFGTSKLRELKGELGVYRREPSGKIVKI